MKPDGTNSSSTADGSLRSPKGTHVTEQDCKAGSEVKKCSEVNSTSWTYLFVHHSKVARFEDLLTKDNVTFFVHKTVRYFKAKDTRTVQHQPMPTISGLVFFQGCPDDTRAYLAARFPDVHLCNNCSTGRTAVIPDTQMRPFMRINATSPERIRFLLHPFHYYARNRVRLRITSGDLAGLEGYVIRIDRDRRLVMDVGGMSVAISGVHAEKFEEVSAAEPSAAAPASLAGRNLHERQALIDRYFHPVANAKEASAQAESIDFLMGYVQEEQVQGRMPLTEAWATCAFIIEEIGYYYADIAMRQPALAAPIAAAGAKVLSHMDGIISASGAATRQRYTTDMQELLSKYGYIF